MKSAIAMATALLAWCCLEATSPAAETPGRLSIYAQTGPAANGFEPRSLTVREQELIRQILDVGANVQARYVPDVVTGKIDALDHAGARFGSFSLSSGSPDVSGRVRPLIDELALPVTLSLGTPNGTGTRQLTAWSGCSHIQAIFMLSPELSAQDLQLLAELPALTNLQLGSPGHTRTDRRLRSERTVQRPDRLEIDRTAIAALARVPQLQMLQIYGGIVTADNFDELRNVRRLLIEGVDLDHQAFASCADLPQVRQLSFARSRAMLEAPVSLSGLKNVRTLRLPQLASDFEQTRELAVGLDELSQLKILGFSGLHCSGQWPDFRTLPASIEWVELYDLVVDDFDGLGFADARLQVQHLRIRRSPDTGEFEPLESPGFFYDIRSSSRIAGRQVEAIRVGVRELPPAEFRVIRFRQWTTETHFLDDASVEQLEFESFSPQQQQAVRELARYGLRVGREPLPGGIIMRPLVDVALGWSEPALLTSDVPRIIDAMVKLPIEKLTIRTEDFPLERLADLGDIESLKIFELHRTGLADEHLAIVGEWNQLESLKIISRESTFSPESFERLKSALPECDLDVSAGTGRPLIWRKPRSQKAAGPQTAF